jgi:hypothetical protein
MALKLYEEENIRDIACAIRTKCGTDCTYKVCDMAAAIETIQNENGCGEYDIVVTENADGTQSFAIADAEAIEPTKLVTKTITSNGTYIAVKDGADGYVSVTVDVEVEPEIIEPVLEGLSVTVNGEYTPPAGVDGYNSVVVDVPIVDPVLDTLSITENGTYTPPVGVDGYNSITVDIEPEIIEPTGTITIKTNGTHDVSGYANAKVNVPTGNEALGSIVITENGTYTPPVGIDGYNNINVNIAGGDSGDKPILTSKVITANGVYDATKEGFEGYDSVTVKVYDANISLQDKTITANGTYTADGAYTGLGTVTVDVLGGVIPVEGFRNETIGTDYFEDDYGYVVSGTWYGTKISDYAFYSEWLNKIKTINLPDNLTRIGAHAFDSCNRLSLTYLPEAVTHIGSYAFYYCSRLALISLPVGVTYIGPYAFSHAMDLALTSLPEGVAVIEANAFENTNICLTSLPENLTQISQRAFNGCTDLAITSIPASVTHINLEAFCYCKDLTTITFEGTPKLIAGSAFQDCTNLTTINVPWAEGAVANAPWGATNATINYNYTE